MGVISAGIPGVENGHGHGHGHVEDVWDETDGAGEELEFELRN